MKPDPNFEQIAELWESDKRNFVKVSTMAAYSLIIRNHLLPFFRSMCFIDENSVQDFVMLKLSEGLSQKSVKDILRVLKMIVKFGAKSGNLNAADWEIRFPKDNAPRELPVLTLSQQRILMEYIANNFTFRNLGILICLHTGMRIGEICALKWSDFNTSEGLITVSKTIGRVYRIDGDRPKSEVIISSPKTANSFREIPMTKQLLRIIKSLKGFINDDYYVLTNSLRPTEPRTYRNYYNRLLSSLSLPRVKFHGLRHSFATRCIESHCDYKTVSVILGHANIATTLNLYVHPDLDQKKRCVAKMMRAFGKDRQ
ncbi:MAG: site-specific integrase [Muribaculaceae bacterium]|nr:site-specific integrase [Muribaculaceae bacterium]